MAFFLMLALACAPEFGPNEIVIMYLDFDPSANCQEYNSFGELDYSKCCPDEWEWEGWHDGNMLVCVLYPEEK